MLRVVSTTPAPCVRHRSDADIQVFLRLCAPFPSSVVVRLPCHVNGATLRSSVASLLGGSPHLRITSRGGRSMHPCETLSDIAGAHNWVELDVRVCQPGGKGGFGNMLRAQGGRMSQRGKNESQDSCRDLQGRRLGSIKEAQLLAEYIAKEPERKAALDEAQKRKYAKLERMLGREPKTMADFEEAAEKLDDAGEELSEAPELSAGPSSSQQAPKRKDRLDDHEYVEQSREIVENVRSAVASAMKKRKGKKRALSSTADASNSSSAQPTVSTSSSS
ncbi:hypothetical protein ACI68E_003246 [Malassezia pachydermatis]|uniref:SDE2-like domain-containing protein n=1 Tax=Malassezia pachydermatis TaxID=77020 RepID=A0A0M8MKC3_9BASI|nr:hypothetical protein Malapachy_4044 [Malassezia pachydermatis]KOS14206.1 hypothetical protein Malapachy_4044 [Malassezia pachydermatis]